MKNKRDRDTFKVFLIDDMHYNKLDADMVIVGRLNSITNCGIYAINTIIGDIDYI